MHDSAGNDEPGGDTELAGARFAMGVVAPRQLPSDTGTEVAFAGRSNAGKSSVINTLCNQRHLARTSRTPGRTQQLVVFTIGEGTRRLVDLPGFGYAKVSHAMRAHWDRTIPSYLESRRSLAGLALVGDVRHPLKPQERAILTWTREAGIAVHLLLNKCDKVSRGQARATLLQVRQALRVLNPQSSVQLFSCHTREGLEEARAKVMTWLGKSKKRAPVKIQGD